ncbi:hypothetical protein HNQ07_002193 [Deinococcus metalli]|uniref:Uncharacterized protein n=1 Tax=Deinococcus metalli TaxID=1141878 RepID=A0A7W8NNB6_9DEIO|nr:hypothetical protein [Deinococcus metalli]MBB5376729.1 hypothetical protein [Deinococcus metalli]GHF44902.1 hypothetical protein GCM10017781_21570 [Deinococcus metalli]
MFTIAEAAARSAAETGPETQRLAARGVPGVVVPPAFEEAFYRDGNLPEQLRRVFAAVNPARIDEDALEPLVARAQALIRTTYLLDDAVQVFYRALAAAGLDRGELHVRRPGTLSAESALVIPPGTTALHAVKRLWAQDWAFDAVLSRLDDTGSVALEARPTLIIPGPPGWPDAERAAVLGVEVALVSPLGLVGLP